MIEGSVRLRGKAVGEYFAVIILILLSATCKAAI